MQNSHLSQETQPLFNEAEICERKQPGRWERKKEGEEGERTEKEGDERKKEGEEGERTEKEINVGPPERMKAVGGQCYI